MKDKRVVFMGTPEFSVPVLLMLIKETNVLLDKLRKIKIGNIVTINRLIETSLGFANGVGASKKLLDAYSKPSKRILNFLYKLDKERFLINFKSSQK